MSIASEFIQLNGNYELGLECGMWTQMEIETNI